MEVEKRVVARHCQSPHNFFHRSFSVYKGGGDEDSITSFKKQIT